MVTLNPRDSYRKFIPNIYLPMKCRNVIIKMVPQYVGDPFMNPWEFKDPSNPNTECQTESMSALRVTCRNQIVST